MNEINAFLQYATSGFWVFVGVFLILSLTLKLTAALIFKCWNRFLRTVKVALRGWPPAHIDADGDPITIHTILHPDEAEYKTRKKETFDEMIARFRTERKTTPKA